MVHIDYDLGYRNSSFLVSFYNLTICNKDWLWSNLRILEVSDEGYSLITWLNYWRNSSVQSLSHVQLFATPWTAACQASVSITNSQSFLKLMSIESMMPSSHLILCRPLLLLPPIPPSIRVFSNELTLHIRWPKYWSFSFSISPSSEHPGWTGWISL